MGNMILLVFICIAMRSAVFSHFVRRNSNLDDLVMPDIKFDLNDPKINDNVTYYSYHIHVYFIQQNWKQRNEAIGLRNRFLAQFNISDCNGHCDTWCPRMCHWDLNMSPIGYGLTNILFE